MHNSVPFTVPLGAMETIIRWKSAIVFGNTDTFACLYHYGIIFDTINAQSNMYENYVMSNIIMIIAYTNILSTR